MPGSGESKFCVALISCRALVASVHVVRVSRSATLRDRVPGEDTDPRIAEGVEEARRSDPCTASRSSSRPAKRLRESIPLSASIDLQEWLVAPLNVCHRLVGRRARYSPGAPRRPSPRKLPQCTRAASQTPFKRERRRVSISCRRGGPRGEASRGEGGASGSGGRAGSKIREVSCAQVRNSAGTDERHDEDSRGKRYARNQGKDGGGIRLRGRGTGGLRRDERGKGERGQQRG